MNIILKQQYYKKRTKIINSLNNLGIGTSIYYPKPVPLMSYYKKKYLYKSKNFVNASIISDQSIALPVGPHLSLKDINYIASKLKKIIL